MCWEKKKRKNKWNGWQSVNGKELLVCYNWLKLVVSRCQSQFLAFIGTSTNKRQEDIIHSRLVHRLPWLTFLLSFSFYNKIVCFMLLLLHTNIWHICLMTC